MSEESPKQVTRSGRTIKKPTRYEPEIQKFEDDYGDDEYDSDESSVGSSIGYDSNEGGDSQDEYDSSFVTDGSVSDPDWTDEESESEAESTGEEDTTEEELDAVIDNSDSEPGAKRHKTDE